MTVVTDTSATSVSKQSTSEPTVAVDFGGIIETSRVIIHPFKPDSTTDDYYNFTLQIIGCMPAGKNA